MNQGLGGVKFVSALVCLRTVWVFSNSPPPCRVKRLESFYNEAIQKDRLEKVEKVHIGTSGRRSRGRRLGGRLLAMT